MIAENAYPRVAGVLYFFTVFDLTGNLIVSRVSGSGSFLDTAHSVAASETLYRVGILLGLVGNISTILLAIALYVTLKAVDGNLAMTALLFRLVEAVLGLVVIVLAFTTLQIYLDTSHGTGFDANQLAALADLVSRTAAAGTDVSVVCFSLGSATFFYLFLRSARPCDLGPARLPAGHSRLCRKPPLSAVLGGAAWNRSLADRHRRAGGRPVALASRGPEISSMHRR